MDSGLIFLGLPFTEEVEDYGYRTLHSGHCRSKVMAWHVSRGVERAGDMKREKQAPGVGWRCIFGS